MDGFDREDFETLIAVRESPCVSAFIPTVRGFAGMSQNVIRLKDTLREVEGRLHSREVKASDTRNLLAPLRKLLDDEEFWRHQQDGLAVFLSPAGARIYRVPLHLQEHLAIGDRFHVKPLLPLFTENRRFFVLAVSQNEVRLVRGAAHGADEVSLEGVPKSLAEALKYDVPERQLQYHSGSRTGTGAIYHGNAVGIDDTKSNISRFFHQIDKGLHTILKEERVPLILATVGYLRPIYEDANGYPHLVAETIEGNPDLLSVDELSERARHLLEPHFRQARQDAAARYRELASTGRASRDLQVVVPAACHGRVATLFVPADIQRWGRFDPETGSVTLEASPAPGNDDLLDLSAAYTIVQRGHVYTDKEVDLPDTPLAAVFRY